MIDQESNINRRTGPAWKPCISAILGDLADRADHTARSNRAISRLTVWKISALA